MALTSTVHTFDLTLSDVDRGVYASLSLKVARHPSETAGYMLTRVLAYALEFEEGIAFSTGLSSAEEPALWIRDLTGQLRAWIEVGAPDAARLHKATKLCDRVVVYCHKDVALYLRSLAGSRRAGQRIHAAERVSIIAIDHSFVDAVAARIERRTTMEVSVTEGQIYVDIGGESHTVALVRHPAP